MNCKLTKSFLFDLKAQQQIAIQQQLAHIQQQQQIQHQQYLNQQAQVNSQNLQANQIAMANQNAASQLVQQVVLQQHPQMPTVTVTSAGMNVQPIGHMQHSQNIKPQHQMIINPSQANQMDRGNQMSVVSIASSLNNTALVTSASNVVSY